MNKKKVITYFRIFETIFEKIKKIKFFFLSTLMSCSPKVASYGIILMLGSIQFGFILNYGGLPIESLKEIYPDWDYEKDDQKISFFSNFASLFGCLGGFLILLSTRYLGVKKTICIFNIVNCILWFLYFAFTPDKFILGIVLRCIQGLLTGGLACLTPIHITNLSPDETVGMLGCLNQVGIVLGMVVFSIAATFTNFRTLAIIGAVVDLVQAGAIFILPKEKVDKDKTESIFHIKHIRGIFVVLLLMIFQQFCGINAINSNLSSIMSETGIYIDENLQVALASMAQLVSVFVAAFNMDGVGRRKMFVFSACLIVVAQIFYIVCLNINTDGWIKATCVFLYLLSFGQGLGPVPWFVCHDVFPKSIRLEGQALVTFINMICSFAITYLFPVMKDNIEEYLIMVIFMCITICSIPFGWFFIPKKNEVNDDNLTLI